MENAIESAIHLFEMKYIADDYLLRTQHSARSYLVDHTSLLSLRSSAQSGVVESATFPSFSKGCNLTNNQPRLAVPRSSSPFVLRFEK